MTAVDELYRPNRTNDRFAILHPNSAVYRLLYGYFFHHKLGLKCLETTEVELTEANGAIQDSAAQQELQNEISCI